VYVYEYKNICGETMIIIYTTVYTNFSKKYLTGFGVISRHFYYSFYSNENISRRHICAKLSQAAEGGRVLHSTPLSCPIASLLVLEELA
jgi:hypothetical protein